MLTEKICRLLINEKYSRASAVALRSLLQGAWIGISKGAESRHLCSCRGTITAEDWERGLISARVGSAYKIKGSIQKPWCLTSKPGTSIKGNPFQMDLWEVRGHAVPRLDSFLRMSCGFSWHVMWPSSVKTLLPLQFSAKCFQNTMRVPGPASFHQH